VYYRGIFDPADLRAIGWQGEVFDIGEWGGGVFNGGAWLTIDDRRVDVHYRDLNVVEHELAEARQGRFHWEPLMFHLAGIPSYLVVAELAVNQVLRGSLPRPEYPQPLRQAAPPVWRNRAAMTLRYAKAAYVRRGQVTEVAGALATAAMQTAHAVLAGRGEWVINESYLREWGMTSISGPARTNGGCCLFRRGPGRLCRVLTRVRRPLSRVRDGRPLASTKGATRMTAASPLNCLHATATGTVIPTVLPACELRGRL
jgi:hypothetical protein